VFTMMSASRLCFRASVLLLTVGLFVAPVAPQAQDDPTTSTVAATPTPTPVPYVLPTELVLPDGSINPAHRAQETWQSPSKAAEILGDLPEALKDAGPIGPRVMFAPFADATPHGVGDQATHSWHFLGDGALGLWTDAQPVSCVDAERIGWVDVAELPIPSKRTVEWWAGVLRKDPRIPADCLVVSGMYRGEPGAAEMTTDVFVLKPDESTPTPLWTGPGGDYNSVSATMDGQRATLRSIMDALDAKGFVAKRADKPSLDDALLMDQLGRIVVAAGMVHSHAHNLALNRALLLARAYPDRSEPLQAAAYACVAPVLGRQFWYALIPSVRPYGFRGLGLAQLALINHDKPAAAKLLLAQSLELAEFRGSSYLMPISDDLHIWLGLSLPMTGEHFIPNERFRNAAPAILAVNLCGWDIEDHNEPKSKPLYDKIVAMREDVENFAIMERSMAWKGNKPGRHDKDNRLHMAASFADVHADAIVRSGSSPELASRAQKMTQVLKTNGVEDPTPSLTPGMDYSAVRDAIRPAHFALLSETPPGDSWIMEFNPIWAMAAAVKEAPTTHLGNKPIRFPALDVLPECVTYATWQRLGDALTMSMSDFSKWFGDPDQDQALTGYWAGLLPQNVTIRAIQPVASKDRGDAAVVEMIAKAERESTRVPKLAMERAIRGARVANPESHNALHEETRRSRYALLVNRYAAEEYTRDGARELALTSYDNATREYVGWAESANKHAFVKLDLGRGDDKIDQLLLGPVTGRIASMEVALDAIKYLVEYKKDFVTVHQFIDRCLKLVPYQMEYHMWRAKAYKAEGRCDEAIKALRLAESKPGGNRINASNFYAAMSWRAMECGDPKLAEELAIKAADFESWSYMSLWAAATVAESKKEWRAMSQISSAALQRYSEFVDMIALLVTAEWNLGERELAMSIVAKWLYENPQQNSLLPRVARLHIEAGDNAGALAQADRLLNLPGLTRETMEKMAEEIAKIDQPAADALRAKIPEKLAGPKTICDYATMWETVRKQEIGAPKPTP